MDCGTNTTKYRIDRIDGKSPLSRTSTYVRGTSIIKEACLNIYTVGLISQRVDGTYVRVYTLPLVHSALFYVNSETVESPLSLNRVVEAEAYFLSYAMAREST